MMTPTMTKRMTVTTTQRDDGDDDTKRMSQPPPLLEVCLGGQLPIHVGVGPDDVQRVETLPQELDVLVVLALRHQDLRRRWNY